MAKKKAKKKATKKKTAKSAQERSGKARKLKKPVRKQAKKTAKKKARKKTARAKAASVPEVVDEIGSTDLTARPLKPSSRDVVPSRGDDLLQSYMREVTKHPLLTREEEHELAVQYYSHDDRDAFQKLVTSNLRFVVKIAYQYVNYRLRLLDLIQEGNMGLVKAVKEFDPFKGVRLTTYAVWWIRSYIQDSILRNYSLVKIGTTQAQKKLFYRLRKEQAKLEKMGIAPEKRVKLLAANLDVREKDVIEMDQRMGGPDFSLNAPVGSDDEKNTHMDHLSDESESVDSSLADNEQATIFKKVLTQFGETLEGREKDFFFERLIAEKPQTLQSLGDRFGVSKERARQIEEKLKNKLKEFVAEKYPDFELLAKS